MGKEVCQKCTPKILGKVEQRAIPACHVPILALPPPAQHVPKNAFPLFFRGSGTPPPEVVLPCQNAPILYGFTKPGVHDKKWGARLGPPKLLATAIWMGYEHLRKHGQIGVHSLLCCLVDQHPMAYFHVSLQMRRSAAGTTARTRSSGSSSVGTPRGNWFKRVGGGSMGGFITRIGFSGGSSGFLAGY